jgi:glycosyltransferase involved in cell wall biosynthesis
LVKGDLDGNPLLPKGLGRGGECGGGGSVTVRASVVVTVFGTEDYLPRCLQSLVDQTYNCFEIIVIDDCSPGNCKSIVDEFHSVKSNIRYVRHERNMGTLASRVVGAELSVAEYVAYLDSDDRAKPDFVEVLLTNANATRADIVGCLSQEDKNSYYFEIRGADEVLKAYVNKTIQTYNVWTKIYRRDFILGISALRELSRLVLNHSEDLLFNVICALHSPSYVNVPEVLVDYNRSRPDSASNILDAAAVVTKIQQFLLVYDLVRRYAGEYLHLVEKLIARSAQYNYRRTLARCELNELQTILLQLQQNERGAIIISHMLMASESDRREILNKQRESRRRKPKKKNNNKEPKRKLNPALIAKSLRLLLKPLMHNEESLELGGAQARRGRLEKPSAKALQRLYAVAADHFDAGNFDAAADCYMSLLRMRVENRKSATREFLCRSDLTFVDRMAAMGGVHQARAIYDYVKAYCKCGEDLHGLLNLVPVLFEETDLNSQCRDFEVLVQTRLDVVSYGREWEKLISTRLSALLALQDYSRFRETVSDLSQHTCPSTLHPYISILRRLDGRENCDCAKVFVIGLPKTGTTSLAEALRILGLRSVHWVNPLTSQIISDVDLPFFDAFSDISISCQFDKFFERVPGAKFIYTTRPIIPWVQSLVGHYRRHHGCRDWEELKHYISSKSPIYRGEKFRSIHKSTYTQYDTPEDAYLNHDYRVMDFFANKHAAHFLQFDVFSGDSWQGLCHFLNRPLPRVPFPWKQRATDG